MNMRLGEIVGGRIDIAAFKFVLVGEGDGVDDEIEVAPFCLDGFKRGIDGGHVGDIAGHDDFGAHFGGQGFNALLQGIALIGEGQFRALIGAGLGNAPGD